MSASRIHQDLSFDEIARVITHIYGINAKVYATKLLKGGLFNTTYLVKTNADEAGIILRAAPTNQAVLLDFEKSMMSAEPWFYKRLHEADVPAPVVLHHDNSRKIIPREYILFRYLPSVSMNHPTVPNQVKGGLYRQLGAIIARLHSIQHDEFGWMRPTGEMDMYPTWSSFLQRFANEISEKAARERLFYPEELARFQRVFAAPKVFEQINIGRMVHADLWEGNVLVREKRGRWEIAALIDVDKAVFGDPMFEFAFPTVVNSDFLVGYGAQVESSSDTRYRRKAYQLLYHFMYTYIWHAQFADDARSLAENRSGLELLASFETF